MQTVKQDALEAADEAGAAFVAFFTTFGTFAIAAGILLIFLVFVMLAAERRGELGIARAVGTRRGHLVQMFTFEGAAYDLAAAAVGALLGALVAFGMVFVMASAFGAADADEGFQIEFAVTPTSLVDRFCDRTPAHACGGRVLCVAGQRDDDLDGDPQPCRSRRP